MAAPSTWSAEVAAPQPKARSRRLPSLRPSSGPAREAPAAHAPATEADAARQAAELMAAFARLTPSRRAELGAHAARLAAGE
jgi:hypothetical protein